MLRTLELEKQVLPENNSWAPFLNAAGWAIRSTYHTILEATPGQLIFGRDMILLIQFKADWASILLQCKQEQIIKDNVRENSQRIPHGYHIGDKVLLKYSRLIPKLSQPRDGPYRIIQTYRNGTARICRGSITQRVNIRRLTPYHKRTNWAVHDID
jgi:mRNA-degrading endonuclease RelE of RelBE toxin-antitoxin system